jgi:3-oxoacyl-ACP reductase-like protein
MRPIAQGQKQNLQLLGRRVRPVGVVTTIWNKGGMSMARLKGKVAVVTGASKGIGAAIAQRFGEEGASVVVHYGQKGRGESCGRD